MRKHEPFTVLPRRMPSGEVVWYYRARLEDGRRSTAWSTGQATRSAARAHCRMLEKDGKLIQAPSWGLKKLGLALRVAPVTFGDLAKDFWTWNPPSPYIDARLKFSDPDKPAISERYAHDCARIVANHLLPTFGRRHLAEITPQEIESFSLRIRDAGLSGKRVNNVISCLRTVLSEAYRAGTLPWDPGKKDIIRAMGSATRQRGILTRAEVRALFAEDAIETAWKGHTLYRAVNAVAAISGMRQGEILAVRDQDIRDHFIVVSHSWTIGYGLGPTKTRQTRIVPISEPVMAMVRPFMGSGGFVFSMTRGETPCTGNRCTEALYAALDSIGVSDREARNVTFHSWRHWWNSTLRAKGVADALVKEITGHATQAMTEHYTNFKIEHFAPVVAVQEGVFE
jgi:integrase